MRHTFEIVLSLTLGTEEEHMATVTGSFERGYAGDRIDPPEADHFEIETVTVEIGGKSIDLFPLLTTAQLAAIADEGVADVGCLPLPRTIAA